MNIERAQKLANFLRTVSPLNFDMSTFSSERKWPHRSSACAGGWACMIDDFQREGLHLAFLDKHKTPEYYSSTGTDALEDFFGIDSNIGWRWFSPATYFGNPTPNEVANRIETDITWYRNKVNAELVAQSIEITEKALAKAAITI